MIDKIIRGVILKEGEKISILGRSAGGGVSIWMYLLDSCNYVDGLNLAAPGYDKTGLKPDFIEKATRDNLNIRLSYSPRDIKVSNEEIMNMKDRLSVLENFEYIEVEDTRSDKPSINHRIHLIALKNLV